METKIAVISIIVEDSQATKATNEVLHQYSDYIVGRMGIPYREKEISIISIVVDAPQGEISSLSGKLGMITGINVKAIVAKTSKK